MMRSTDQQAITRLLGLDGAEVWLSIVRGAGPHGAGVVRRGTVRVVATEDQIRRAEEAGYELIFARIADAAGVPVALVSTHDSVMDWNAVIHVERRLTFAMDVSEQRPPGIAENAVPALYAAKSLVAELEACLRTSMMVSPDPDADASWKAAYRDVIPFQPDPPFVVPSTMHIGANTKSATLRWRDDAVNVTLFVPTAGPNGAVVVTLVAPDEGRYDYSDASLERLGAVLRAHFQIERRAEDREPTDG